jgi:phage terminase large subunit-like protein
MASIGGDLIQKLIERINMEFLLLASQESSKTYMIAGIAIIFILLLWSANKNKSSSR